MALFDPAAVNRQIDSILTAVPQGKKLTLVGHADLMSKKASAAIVFRLGDSVSAFARVSKTAGEKVEADTGFKISFLAELPEEQGFSYNELVAIFRHRGFGFVKSHISAYRLLNGGSVEL